MLIIAGSLVGSSGAILSYIMCKAMNRSFISVIMGGSARRRRGGRPGTGDKTGALRIGRRRELPARQRRSVVIVPGYGLRWRAPARGEGDGAKAHRQGRERPLYAIHPVAGRMPGT